MNFSGKEGQPNIQPSTRPGIEPGTSGLGGRDLNHCANPSALRMSASNILTKVLNRIVSIGRTVVIFHSNEPTESMNTLS